VLEIFHALATRCSNASRSPDATHQISRSRRAMSVLEIVGDDFTAAISVAVALKAIYRLNPDVKNAL